MAAPTFVLIIVPDVVILLGMEQRETCPMPACSENPTTATTPALTMLESLLNVTVIVDWDPVTVGNPGANPLWLMRIGESVLEPSYTRK